VSLFIDEHRERFGVEPICTTLGGSVSAYYQRRSGDRSARAVEDERLLARIRELHAANYYAYGYRRMWKALRRQELQARNTVAEDHDFGLVAIVGKVHEVRDPAGRVSLNVGLSSALLAAHEWSVCHDGPLGSTSAEEMPRHSTPGDATRSSYAAAVSLPRRTGSRRA
jgi:HTH-like domain